MPQWDKYEHKKLVLNMKLEDIMFYSKQYGIFERFE